MPGAPGLDIERVEHGFIITTVLPETDRGPDGRRRYIAIELDSGSEAGKAMQYPFIGDDGQVGLCLKHEDGRVEYIYFNSSNGGGDEGPGGGPGFNTFVYQGTEGTPTEDGSLHFYYLFDPEDWDEPEGVNDSPTPLEPEDK